MLLSFIAANAQWQKTNGPVGPTRSFLYPGNNGEIFNFTTSGDLYASQDTGSSWQIRYPSSDFISIADYERDGSNIWICSFSTLQYEIKSGIFLSMDNGRTWENKRLSQNGINDLAIQDSNIYAATYYGLYSSTDYGDSWSKIETGILVTPEVTNCVYINGDTVFIGYDSGIFRSTNKGETWIEKIKGLPRDSTYKIMLPVSRIFQKDGALFAYMPSLNSSQYSRPTYLCKSTDNGENWKTVFGGDFSNSFQSNILIKGDSMYVFNPSTLYLSIDNGDTWFDVNDTLPDAFNTIVVVGNKMIAGATTGVYTSTDDGKSWNRSDKGFPNVTVYDLEVNGDNLYAAANMGISLTTDDGETWNNYNNGLPPGQDIRTITTDGNHFFATQIGNSNNIFMSTDNGENWSLTPSSIPTTYIGEIKIYKGNVIATSSSGIYISSDWGSTWVKSNISDSTTSLSILAIDGDWLYAGSSKGVFLSTDNGLNWNSIIAPYLWNITALTAKDGILYISNGSNIYAKYNDFPYWYIIAVNLTSGIIKINNILIEDNNIIVGTTGAGVIVSTDAGFTWNQRNEGLPILKYVSALKIKGDYIYAAISGSSVYKAKFKDITTSIREENAQLEHSTAYLQYTNTYPIPASDIVRSTVYWNSVYNIMDAQIEIYNMYGIKQNNPEISIEKQADYKANIVWNCSGYSAGVYFIRITLGGETMAVPVLINRGN
ncbi:MAG: hypothetical protein ABFD61_07340 [Chloroherpetonaceae bacterium]